MAVNVESDWAASAYGGSDGEMKEPPRRRQRTSHEDRMFVSYFLLQVIFLSLSLSLFIKTSIYIYIYIMSKCFSEVMFCQTLPASQIWPPSNFEFRRRSKTNSLSNTYKYLYARIYM